MTVTVYNSSDASSPSLSGSVGSFISVLDACLVNGYGAKSAAGWTKVFSGTNLAVYRPSTGNRYYLRVDDTGTSDARLTAFLTMSDINTGTGVFPLASQVAGGLFLKKSTTVDATARGWMLVATGSAFYFFGELSATPTTWVVTSATTSGNGHMFFGDFTSYKPNDIYNTALIAPGVTTASNGVMGIKTGSISGAIGGATGHNCARSFAQVVGSSVFAKGTPSDYTSSTTFAVSTALPTFPDPVTGGILMGPIEILEPSQSMVNMIIRGRLPGLWAPVHNLPGSQGDTFNGAGDLAGKAFTVVNTYNAATIGRLFMETSNTW